MPLPRGCSISSRSRRCITTRAEPDHVLLLHRLADHRERLVGDLVVRHDVEGLVEIDLVHLVARHERLDVDRVGAFERHLVELVLLEQHVLPVVDLVALDLVLRSRPTSPVSESIAWLRMRLPVSRLMMLQADAARRARCGVHRDRARDERQLQVALPGRARCHDAHSTRCVRTG